MTTPSTDSCQKKHQHTTAAVATQTEHDVHFNIAPQLQHRYQLHLIRPYSDVRPCDHSAVGNGLLSSVQHAMGVWLMQRFIT